MQFFFSYTRTQTRPLSLTNKSEKKKENIEGKIEGKNWELKELATVPIFKIDGIL
jgi:hypothetical protein